MSKNKNLIWIILFSIAMAYLESAVVVYLRAMYGIKDLLRDTPLLADPYTIIEIGREAATLVMLFLIGLIAGNTWQKRIGYSIFAFAIWDIFYYVWLFLFIHWPKSLFEWDILFLIPLPWWGPVITPILISLLLITVAYLLIIEVKFKITSFNWIIFCLSIFIILYTFMEDSIKIILSGGSNLNEARPTDFNWILFLIAYISMIITSIKVFYTNRNS
ncbi:MAG: hypothetical protein OQJ93_06775 [Ignavibacteriaceae bacterium]|nr:hypothetical protein [Ignavibacteriaceae bacterium]